MKRMLKVCRERLEKNKKDIFKVSFCMGAVFAVLSFSGTYSDFFMNFEFSLKMAGISFVVMMFVMLIITCVMAILTGHVLEDIEDEGE